METRKSNGEYAKKKMPLAVKIIGSAIIIGAIVFPAVSAQFQPEVVKADVPVKRADLNTELQALIEKRTQEAMKDPNNINEYHDMVERRVNDAINTLTGKI